MWDGTCGGYAFADVAICKTVLQHITDAITILEKMRDSVVPGGKVICMECDRNIANAMMYFDGIDYERLNNLGVLQKLWFEDFRRSGMDHNIGMKIPVYMQKIGLRDVEVRLNDRVGFINPQGNGEIYAAELDSFLASGWGDFECDREKTVGSLMNRGLTLEEAEYQFDCEMVYNRFMRECGGEAMIVHALGLIVSFGTVEG